MVNLFADKVPGLYCNNLEELKRELKTFLDQEILPEDYVIYFKPSFGAKIVRALEVALMNQCTRYRNVYLAMGNGYWEICTKPIGVLMTIDEIIDLNHFVFYWKIE